MEFDAILAVRSGLPRAEAVHAAVQGSIKSDVPGELLYGTTEALAPMNHVESFFDGPLITEMAGYYA
jgi:hypothetical protein